MRAVKSVNIDVELLSIVEKYMKEEAISTDSDAFENLVKEGLISKGYVKRNDKK